MKSIKDIYNGILGDIDTRLDKMDSDINDINSTYFERILSIISKAADLNVGEKVTLRTWLKSFANKYNHCLLYIPTTLRDKLIVLSNHKLTKADFDGIPNNKKEYDFSVSLEYQYLVRNNRDLEKFLKGQIKPPFKKFMMLNNSNVGIFGNAKMCLYDAGQSLLLYVWFPDNYRLVVRFGDYGYNSKYARCLF